MFASGCDIDEDGAMFPMDTTYIYVLFMGTPFVSRDMICRTLLDKRDFRMGNERRGEAAGKMKRSRSNKLWKTSSKVLCESYVHKKRERK